MHIVYEKEQADSLKDRYTVLELDTVDVQEVDKKLTLYAIVDPAKIGLEGLSKLGMWVDLHENLIKNPFEEFLPTASGKIFIFFA